MKQFAKYQLKQKKIYQYLCTTLLLGISTAGFCQTNQPVTPEATANQLENPTNNQTDSQATDETVTTNQTDTVKGDDYYKEYGILLPNNPAPNQWIDHQHTNTSQILNKTAHKIDNWFGKPDPNDPATASLRIISDTTWNETDGTSSKVRVRGRIKLPTLENKLSVVFGDERLDDVASRTSIYAPLPQNAVDDNTIKQDIKDNSSLAVRWSDFSKKLPFETDFDIGIRAHGNIFARLKAKKDWKINDNIQLFSEQSYRYSKRDKSEIFSYWEFYHQQDGNTALSLPINFHYQETSDDDLDWDTALLQTHHYDRQRKLSYGLYTDGYVNDHNWEINRKGVIASWRQPIWREWLFLQTDIDYLDNKRENKDHEFGGLLRIEALF